MSLITWSDKFRVHVKGMDMQHHEPVDMFNVLHDAMPLRQGKAQVEKTLDELVNYTVYHLTAEERLMKQLGYEGFDKHKAKHEELKAQVLQVQTKIKSGHVDSSAEVLRFLKNWLTDHIQQDDAEYGLIMAEAETMQAVANSQPTPGKVVYQTQYGKTSLFRLTVLMWSFQFA